jgi:hypothetical protein
MDNDNIKRISKIQIKEVADSIPRVQLKYIDTEGTEYDVKTKNVIPSTTLVGMYNEIGFLLAKHSELPYAEVGVEYIKIDYDDDVGEGLSAKIVTRNFRDMYIVANVGPFWSDTGNENTLLPEDLEVRLSDLKIEIKRLLSGRRGQMSLFDKEESVKEE